MTAGKSAIVLLGLLAAGPAAADLDGVTGAEPPATPPGWLLPSPAVQLEMDAELIPVGKGAVFVPAMSEAAAEPPYLVLDAQGEVVARSPTGSKTILAPGRYQVKVGSGVEEQMLNHQVTVHEGHTTLVKPDWAGMIVRVVDEHGTQIRGTYEIFALPSGEDFGLGLGADETRGETLRTWLLPPGRYMLVRSGETPRARTDFLTVQLEPGELTHFTLVQDEEGNFEGGGVVDRWEGRTEIENWRLGLIVGGMRCGTATITCPADRRATRFRSTPSSISRSATWIPITWPTSGCKSTRAVRHSRRSVKALVDST
jgi:hypothetical protein